MFSKETNKWIKVIATSKWNGMTKDMEIQTGEYWHFKHENGVRQGAYFKLRSAWGILEGADVHINPDEYLVLCPQAFQEGTHQHDGPLETPSSMTPASSPNTSAISSAPSLDGSSTLPEELQGKSPTLLSKLNPFRKK